MRILYVHETMGVLGGAESNVIITSSELKERGHDVALIYSRQTNWRSGTWDHVFEKSFRFDRTTGTDELEAFVESFRPDVIYVHKWSEPIELLEYVVRSGHPCIRMIHDHDTYCMRGYRYHPLTRKPCNKPSGLHCVFPCLANIERTRNGPLPIGWKSYSSHRKQLQLNHDFDEFFVVTEFMRQQLLLNGFESARISIMPPVPRQQESSITSTFSNRNLIVYAGQIIRGKGVDYFLRALSTMESSFEAVILGDGSHRKYCEALARKLGLSARVQFKGFVPQEELMACYSGASAVVISSVWPEPIATIGLEVMRFGLPVVAFDSGGIRDWLIDGHNGFLVSPFDHASMGKALDKLMADKSMARTLGDNGRNLVNRKYDFADYIQRLEKKFQESGRSRRMSLQGGISGEDGHCRTVACTTAL